MNIVVDWFGILDTYGLPVLVRRFPGIAEVIYLIDALKFYDPAYNENLCSKSCLNKCLLYLISSTS